jgi:peptidoglycan/LPS O-acetylase OafA/YrhL
MYLFLPMLYMLVTHSGKRAPYYIGALWLAAVVLVLVFWRLNWPYAIIMFLPCFLPGVLAFCLRRTRQDFSPLVLFLFVVAAAILDPRMVSHGVKATILSWPFCLLLGLIIPKCRDIQLGWLRITGKEIARYSYGIYLIHVPMLNFSFHYLHEMPLILQWVTFVAGTAGISYIAHHAIEKPCIEFGKGVVNRLTLSRAESGSKV